MPEHVSSKPCFCAEAGSASSSPLPHGCSSSWGNAATRYLTLGLHKSRPNFSAPNSGQCISNGFPSLHLRRLCKIAGRLANDNWYQKLLSGPRPSKKDPSNRTAPRPQTPFRLGCVCPCDLLLSCMVGLPSAPRSRSGRVAHLQCRLQ